MYRSKQQLLLPGFFKFSLNKSKITDPNILKTRTVGLRGGKKLPRIYFPISNWHVVPSKQRTVQLNPKTSESSIEKISSKVGPLKLSRAKKSSKFPYQSKLRLSSN